MDAAGEPAPSCSELSGPESQARRRGCGRPLTGPLRFLSRHTTCGYGPHRELRGAGQGWGPEWPGGFPAHLLPSCVPEPSISLTEPRSPSLKMGWIQGLGTMVLSNQLWRDSKEMLRPVCPPVSSKPHFHPVPAPVRAQDTQLPTGLPVAPGHLQELDARVGHS